MRVVRVACGHIAAAEVRDALAERVAEVAEADAAVAEREGAVTVVEKSVDVGNGTPRVSRRPRTDAREDIPDCGQSDNAWTRALRPD